MVAALASLTRVASIWRSETSRDEYRDWH